MDYLFTIRGEAMEPEGYKKAGSLRSIFFALVASEPLWALKELFVSFREMRELDKNIKNEMRTGRPRVSLQE